MEINMSGGYVAIIDDDDWGKISNIHWYTSKGKHTRYAQGFIRRDGKKHTVMMHRVILGLTDRSVQVDHINGNGLDNRKSNIRPCSYAQNNYNTRPVASSVVKYKGVHISEGKFRARITVDGVKRSLGVYWTAEDAATAYDKAAKRFFGDFAWLNFPTANPQPCGESQPRSECRPLE